MTLNQVSDTHGVPVADLRVLRHLMAEVWAGIASDWLAGFESEQDAYDLYGSEGAMLAEATIDAGRLVSIAGADPAWLDGLRRMSKPTGGILELAEDAWDAHG